MVLENVRKLTEFFSLNFAATPSVA